MYLNTDYIDPAELTGYVREAQADFQINQFLLSQFVPNRVVDDLDYRFLAGGEGLSEVGSYRAYDTEAPLAGRPGIKRVTGELPPISRKMRFGEYDRLRQRQLTDPIQTGLFTDAARLTRSISARLEVARADALVNGSVTIEENGLVATIDFNRPDSCSVTPATAWSDTSGSDPLTDLNTWVQAYIAMNGQPIGTLVISTQVATLLQQNTALRGLAATVVGSPAFLSRDALSATFVAYGLPPFIVYDAMVNQDGAATRVVPADQVLLLPEPVDQDDFEGTQLGGTFWGTTAESLDPGYGLEGADGPGIVAGVYDTQDPIALWTKAAAISVPVLANPQLAWVADVL